MLTNEVHDQTSNNVMTAYVVAHGLYYWQNIYHATPGIEPLQIGVVIW